TQWSETHRRIADRYALALRGSVAEPMPPTDDPWSHVHHLFVVRSQHRDELRRHLSEHEIESLVHYPVPVHLQAPMREMRRDPKGLAVTERQAQQCLSLPCHPYLTHEQQQHVIDVVRAFVPS